MKHLSLAALLLLFLSCTIEDDGGSDVDIQETAQQVGDVIASIDEAGGSSGSYAYDNLFKRFDDQILPSFSFDAVATTCGFLGGFSTCVDGEITRTFGDCTVGLATYTGTVLLTFSEIDCSLASRGDYVIRAPNFTVTGRRGATLHVEKSGTVGQTITRTNSEAPRTYSMSNDGIRRYFVKEGVTEFDYTTTATNIFFSGSTRLNRVITAGELTVVDNLTEEICVYEPTNVTYSATCNCATSGSWAGLCGTAQESEEEKDISTITHTGCGTATFVKGDESEDVTFDRCYDLAL